MRDDRAASWPSGTGSLGGVRRARGARSRWLVAPRRRQRPTPSPTASPPSGRCSPARSWLGRGGGRRVAAGGARRAARGVVDAAGGDGAGPSGASSTRRASLAASADALGGGAADVDRHRTGRDFVACGGRGGGDGRLGPRPPSSRATCGAATRRAARRGASPAPWPSTARGRRRRAAACGRRAWSCSTAPTRVEVPIDPRPARALALAGRYVAWTTRRAAPS